jgi:hypothetical protein
MHTCAQVAIKIGLEGELAIKQTQHEKLSKELGTGGRLAEGLRSRAKVLVCMYRCVMYVFMYVMIICIKHTMELVSG